MMLLFAAGVAGLLGAEREYGIWEIAQGAQGRGLNNKGVVVGVMNGAGFTWQRGEMTMLPAGTELTAVNDRGEASGYAKPVGGAQYPFSYDYQQSVLTKLPSDRGLLYPVSINNGGQMVGVGDGMQPLLWTGFVMQTLPMWYAASINNLGEVAGTCTSVGMIPVACVERNGMPEPIPALAGPTSRALAINDAGDIAGNAQDGGTLEKSFFYRQGTTVVIAGEGSTVGGMNRWGTVVGTMPAAGGGTRAYLYLNGTTLDVNTLLPAGSSYTITKGIAINDVGSILAVALKSGQEVLVLLSISGI